MPTKFVKRKPPASPEGFGHQDRLAGFISCEITRVVGLALVEAEHDIQQRVLEILVEHSHANTREHRQHGSTCRSAVGSSASPFSGSPFSASHNGQIVPQDVRKLEDQLTTTMLEEEHLLERLVKDRRSQSSESLSSESGKSISVMLARITNSFIRERDEIRGTFGAASFGLTPESDIKSTKHSREPSSKSLAPTPPPRSTDPRPPSSDLPSLSATTRNADPEIPRQGKPSTRRLFCSNLIPLQPDVKAEVLDVLPNPSVSEKLTQGVSAGTSSFSLKSWSSGVPNPPSVPVSDNFDPEGALETSSERSIVNRTLAAIRVQRFWRSRAGNRQLVSRDRGVFGRDRLQPVGSSCSAEFPCDLNRVQKLHISELCAQSISDATRDSSGNTTSYQGHSRVRFQSSQGDHSSASDFDTAANDIVMVPAWLRVFGFVPWSSTDGGLNKPSKGSLLYQAMVCFALTVACGTSVVQTVSLHATLNRSHDKRMTNLFEAADIAFSIGTFMCLLCTWKLRRNGCELLGAKGTILALYAESRGYARLWYCRSRTHSIIAIAAWFVIVTARVVCQVLAYSPDVSVGQLIVSSLAFSFESGFFTAMIFCLVHVSNALILMVDHFCCSFAQRPCAVARKHDWNMLQAILRRASGALSPCFLFAHVVAFSVLFLCLWGTVVGSSVLPEQWISVFGAVFPALMLTLMVGWLLYRVSGVTARCERVPAFVNSLDTGGRSLQSVVNFVSSSAAGFYICETKLPACAAVKALYLFGIVILSVGTYLFSVE
eukprot:TRINITY_DN36700_c0_g1_i1.p1 TRINITY_DN36700_c0_g1~~TRINITY_DN36700_c0_g1_i1.p1  ORF type:complete len:772 (+),score=70.59 TRINITY_DN36700_c0_g1_i1:68-2383(+)